MGKCYLVRVSGSPSSAPSRELLLATHAFPGEYMIKVFGPGQAEFRAVLIEQVGALVERERMDVRHRSTASGHRTCVTVTWRAHTVDEVIEMYRLVQQVPDVLLIL